MASCSSSASRSRNRRFRWYRGQSAIADLEDLRPQSYGGDCVD
jgi:hypothetical protein